MKADLLKHRKAVILTILSEIPMKCISLPSLAKAWKVDFVIATQYNTTSQLLMTFECPALLLNTADCPVLKEMLEDFNVLLVPELSCSSVPGYSQPVIWGLL